MFLFTSKSKFAPGYHPHSPGISCDIPWEQHISPHVLVETHLPTPYGPLELYSSCQFLYLFIVPIQHSIFGRFGTAPALRKLFLEHVLLGWPKGFQLQTRRVSCWISHEHVTEGCMFGWLPVWVGCRVSILSLPKSPYRKCCRWMMPSGHCWSGQRKSPHNQTASTGNAWHAMYICNTWYTKNMYVDGRMDGCFPSKFTQHIQNCQSACSRGSISLGHLSPSALNPRDGDGERERGRYSKLRT